MKLKKYSLKDFFLNIDQYISAILCIVIMLLLTAQVITRYVFNNSLTWTEELATLLFVFMVYFGVSSAVTYRKHLRVDAVLEAVPFKVKRVLLILSDIISMVFCLYIIVPFFNIIQSLGASKSPILGIPKVISYAFIPMMFFITAIKFIINIYKLIHEEEKELGSSKPTLDLEKYESERERNK